MLLSEENIDNRKEKMLLKLVFKYCQYASTLLILQDVKEIQF